MSEKKLELNDDELEKIIGGMTINGDMIAGICGDSAWHCPDCMHDFGVLSKTAIPSGGLYCPTCQKNVNPVQ